MLKYFTPNSSDFSDIIERCVLGRGKIPGTIRCREQELVSFCRSTMPPSSEIPFKHYYASTTFPLRFSDEANGKTDIIIVAEKRSVIASLLALPFRHPILRISFHVQNNFPSKLSNRRPFKVTCFRAWELCDVENNK